MRILIIFLMVVFSANIAYGDKVEVQPVLYSIEELYVLALRNSERIKIAEEDLKISELAKDKAASVLFPTLSAFGNYTKYSESKLSSTGSVIQTDNSRYWGLRLDQSFSLSGREITAFRIAKENIEKSRHELDAVYEEYLINVSKAYFDLLLAKKAGDIADANVKRLTKHRDAAMLRLKVGEATKTALLRAEAELSGAMSDMIIAENNIKLARALLARLAGIEGAYDLKVPADTGIGYGRQGIADNSELEGLKQTAYSERSELKALKIYSDIAEKQVDYAKGAYWPSLSLEAVYYRKDEDPASAFLNKESTFGGITLSFPFFDGGLRKAGVSEAKAKKRQSDLLLEDLRKAIATEVETAYLDLIAMKSVLKSLEDLRSYAADNFNAVSKQFEHGLADSVSVMDANTLLVTAERQSAAAELNYQLSAQKLKRAAGILMKEANIRRSAAHKTEE